MLTARMINLEFMRSEMGQDAATSLGSASVIGRWDFFLSRKPKLRQDKHLGNFYVMMIKSTEVILQQEIAKLWQKKKELILIFNTANTETHVKFKNGQEGQCAWSLCTESWAGTGCRKCESCGDGMYQHHSGRSLVQAEVSEIVVTDHHHKKHYSLQNIT